MSSLTSIKDNIMCTLDIPGSVVFDFKHYKPQTCSYLKCFKKNCIYLSAMDVGLDINLNLYRSEKQ